MPVTEDKTILIDERKAKELRDLEHDIEFAEARVTSEKERLKTARSDKFKAEERLRETVRRLNQPELPFDEAKEEEKPAKKDRPVTSVPKPEGKKKKGKDKK